MRIIDKNKDFYDYMQGILVDNKFTFDRRGSIPLSKAEFAELFRYKYRESVFYDYDDELHHPKYIMLQAGNYFWLFTLQETVQDPRTRDCLDFDLQFITSWKNYDAPRVKLQLSYVGLTARTVYGTWYYSRKEKPNYDDPKTIKRIVDSIISGETKTDPVCREGTPILMNTKIPSCINAQDIYLALEEYFSLEKTESERVESIGLIDKEKIVNRGFDVKTSFRGKQ